MLKAARPAIVLPESGCMGACPPQGDGTPGKGAIRLKTRPKTFTAHAGLAAALLSSVALSGCMSSPTYGTAKTANAQLATDVSSMLSLGSKKRNDIDYKPRPEIVKPLDARTETAALPDPQEDVVKSGNSAWPESPEQRLARIRADATSRQGDAAFEPDVVMEKAAITPPKISTAGSMLDEDERVTAAQREEYKRRRKEAGQGSSSDRKFLSEPPLEYRVPAATAVAGEIGEDEAKKERERKKASKKKREWRDIVPWL